MSLAQFNRFSSGERTAVVIISAAAVLSVSAIAFLLLRVAIFALKPIIQGLRGRKDSKEAVFFHTQLGLYAACLICANLLSGIAGLFEVVWAFESGITQNAMCQVQAGLLQVGDFASAYFTTIIAIHTFNSLVLRKRSPTWFSAALCLLGWTGAVLMGTVVSRLGNAKLGPFYADVGLWCWISDQYSLAQFVLHYLPIFVAAAVTVIYFSLIFLCLRGTLMIGDGIKLNLTPERVQGWAGRVNGSDEYRVFLGAIVRSMLWYPFAFVVLLSPISVCRLMFISGIKVSTASFTFAATCAALLGFANVVILSNTLRVLKPAFSSPTASRDIDSFFPEQREEGVIGEKPSEEVKEVKAFPPPRPSQDFMRSPATRPDSLPQQLPMAHYLSHQKSDSNMSITSTTRLLPASNAGRYGMHSQSRSDVSTSSFSFTQVPAASFQRPILSPQQFNNIDGVLGSVTDGPMDARSPLSPQSASHKRFASDSSSLPPPPRSARARTPPPPLLPAALTSPLSPLSSGDFVDVNLRTPAPRSAKSPERPSWNRPRPSLEGSSGLAGGVRPSLSAIGRVPRPAPVPDVVSPIASESSGASSARESTFHSSDDEQLRSEILSRVGAAPEQQGISSLAWASLVTNAAVGTGQHPHDSYHDAQESDITDSPLSSAMNTGSPSRSQFRLSKVPAMLRPRADPGSARPAVANFFYETRQPSSAGFSQGSLGSPNAVVGDVDATFRTNSGPRRWQTAQAQSQPGRPLPKRTVSQAAGLK